MATVNSVSVDGVDTTILPGSLVLEGRPITVVKQNEPCVVTGYRKLGQFLVDHDDMGAIAASAQGAGAVDLVIDGITINDATISIETGGEGVQTHLVKFVGSET